MKRIPTTTIHLRGADARNFMKAVAADRASADEGSEENRHLPLLIAMEAAQRELLARLENAEAERDTLVGALEGCKNLLECMRDDSAINEVFQREAAFEIGQASAALARVKGAV